MNKQQGIAWVPLFIIIGVVVVAGIVTYAVIQTNKSNEVKNSNTAITNATVNRTNTNTTANTNVNAVANTNDTINTNTSTVPADWKTYTNDEHRYTFQYPNDWEIYVSNDQLNPIEGSSNADFATISYNPDDSAYPDLIVDIRAYTINPAATLREIAVLDEDLGTKNSSFVQTVTNTFSDTIFVGYPALTYSINSANNPDGTELYYINEILFRKDDTVIEIEAIASTPQEYANAEKTFNVILSSFLFTGQGQ